MAEISGTGGGNPLSYLIMQALMQGQDPNFAYIPQSQKPPGQYWPDDANAVATGQMRPNRADDNASLPLMGPGLLNELFRMFDSPQARNMQPQGRDDLWRGIAKYTGDF
jgi:hypothetical protein